MSYPTNEPDVCFLPYIIIDVKPNGLFGTNIITHFLMRRFADIDIANAYLNSFINNEIKEAGRLLNCPISFHRGLIRFVRSFGYNSYYNNIGGWLGTPDGLTYVSDFCFDFCYFILDDISFGVCDDNGSDATCSS